MTSPNPNLRLLGKSTPRHCSFVLWTSEDYVPIFLAFLIRFKSVVGLTLWVGLGLGLGLESTLGLWLTLGLGLESTEGLGFEWVELQKKAFFHSCKKNRNILTLSNMNRKPYPDRKLSLSQKSYNPLMAHHSPHVL